MVLRQDLSRQPSDILQPQFPYTPEKTVELLVERYDAATFEIDLCRKHAIHEVERASAVIAQSRARNRLPPPQGPPAPDYPQADSAERR